MKENFSRSLAMLLRHEGGFVNHPKAPGGMTNRGITKKVYDKFFKWIERIFNIKKVDYLKGKK